MNLKEQYFDLMSRLVRAVTQETRSELRKELDAGGWSLVPARTRGYVVDILNYSDAIEEANTFLAIERSKIEHEFASLAGLEGSARIAILEEKFFRLSTVVIVDERKIFYESITADCDQDLIDWFESEHQTTLEELASLYLAATPQATERAIALREKFTGLCGDGEDLFDEMLDEAGLRAAWHKMEATQNVRD